MGVSGQRPLSGPVKRSVMIAGHATSISLEPIFWAALRDAAAAENLPLNALVARIDADRVEAKSPPNLGSAIRVWLFERALASGASAETSNTLIVGQGE
ncbi:MAG TPA: ribbon-helix-helix domain-containing protein [Allosphingosinicella sp.]